MNRSSVQLALLGAMLGFAWGSALRGMIAVFAGRSSSFTWSGTFVAILLPATLVGAALGWAEHTRCTGGRGRWRWAALSPLLFVVIPALVLEDFVIALITTGIGGGAVATAIIGMSGGYAIAGRGPKWARIVSRTVLLLLAMVIVVGTTVAPFEQRLAMTEPAGAYTWLTFLVLSGLLAGACAIPFLPAHHEIAEDRRGAQLVHRVQEGTM